MKRIILLLWLLSTYGLCAKELAFDIRENIVYTSPGNTKVMLDAFVPKQEGVYPAILVIHGGAWKEGHRHSLRNYAVSLTQMGFVCFAIDYRLAPEHKFPAQIDDCRAAVLWIRANAKEYKVQPAKIGAIGYSAGGHLSTLLATTGEAPSDKNGNVDTRIQAAAAGGAPTEFRWMPADNGKWAEYWMGGDLSTVPEKFHAASSTAFVDKDDAPVFFYNGTADKTVPLFWSMSCYDALKRAGVRTEMYKIEGASHNQAIGNAKALEKAYAFLKEELYK